MVIPSVHPIRVSTLSGWVLPYPAGYEFPLPYGVAAFASWTFLFPLGSFPFLAVWVLTYRVLPVSHGQTPSGFPRFTPLRCDWRGTLSLHRGLGVLTGDFRTLLSLVVP